MDLRRRMDRLLDRCDEETPITNPEEPIRTFFRKLRYRIDVLRSKLTGGGGPRSSSTRRGDGRE